jgi:hypothetical protein
MYNFVEVSEHTLESSQAWDFCMDFLNYRVGGRGKVELESNKTKQKSMGLFYSTVPLRCNPDLKCWIVFSRYYLLFLRYFKSEVLLIYLQYSLRYRAVVVSIP